MHSQTDPRMPTPAPHLGVTAINVFFTPPPPERVAARTLVVVDTLRATTALLSLLTAGAEAAYTCATDAEARSLAAALPAAQLCGERDGLRLDGFDFGNSPSEFARLDLRGRTLVQSTSNGTRALRLAHHAPSTLVGCLRNRAAAATAALATRRSLAIVCAGERLATAPSIEDAFTAGAIVAAALQAPADPPAQLEAGALLALHLFHAYNGDPADAFAESPHAAHLRALGFRDDLTFAAVLDAEDLVPTARIDEHGRVVVHR